MIGAASEKEIYLLADSLVIGLKDPNRQGNLKSILGRRKTSGLFDAVQNIIQKAVDADLIPYSVTEGVTKHLVSLFEAIRVQRNDAVHPMNAKVSEESVRHLIQSLPYALSKFEDVSNWLASNPGGI